MKNVATSKGTWGHRFAIRVFTLILGVLIFWVLGFFVSDIRTIEGPKYEAIEEKHLDKDLLAKQEALTQQIADSNRRIENQTEKQRVVGDSSRNLQQTINQLIELQKLGLQNNVAFSETEQANFTSSLNLFLENQKKYQEHSQTIFIRKLILQDGQPHCGITGHPIENNYAAVFHAKRCDKFQPNPKVLPLAGLAASREQPVVGGPND